MAENEHPLSDINCIMHIWHACYWTRSVQRHVQRLLNLFEQARETIMGKYFEGRETIVSIYSIFYQCLPYLQLDKFCTEVGHMVEIFKMDIFPKSCHFFSTSATDYEHFLH